MSKGFLWFVFLVVIGLVAYWAYYPLGSSITLALSAQNNSGQKGTAIINDDVSGKAHVVVELLNEPQGATEPMHFHKGSCRTIGGVVHTLTPVVNGRSETTLAISTADLLKELPLAINAHKSIAESGIYVACGDVPSK